MSWLFRKKESDKPKHEEREPYTWVSIAEAHKMLAEDQVQLIDVREPYEYRSGHIPGAESVPLNTFLRAPRQYLKRDKVMFVCAVGERSAVACEMAAALGVAEVYNVQGGTKGWMRQGLPVER